MLDTNVISEVFKRKGNAGALDWLAATPTPEVCLSDLTIAEIESGIEYLSARGQQGDQERAQKLRTWVRDDVTSNFSGRILPITRRTLEIWSQLMGMQKVKGGGEFPIDFLYAAQARGCQEPYAKSGLRL